MKYFIIALTLFFVGCKIQQSGISNLNGLYSYKGKEYEYNLLLTNDSFVLKNIYLKAIRQCKGKWLIENDSLTLNCEEEPIIYTISSRYMKERTHKLKIIDAKQLVYKVILKKEKFEINNSVNETKKMY